MIFAIFDTQSVKHTHRLLPKKSAPAQTRGRYENLVDAARGDNPHATNPT